MGNLADQIKTLLTKHQLNPTQLAKATGIPQPVIHRLLHNKTNNPRLDTLLTLANHFGIALDELIGRTSRKTPSSFQSSYHPLSQVPLLALTELTNVINTPTEVFSLQLNNNQFAPFAKKGFYLVVDPNKNVKNADHLLVRSPPNHQLAIKQLVIDQNEPHLASVDRKEREHDKQHLTGKDQILGVITHVIHCSGQEEKTPEWVD